MVINEMTFDDAYEDSPEESRTTSRILVIEDVRVLRDDIVQILQLEGYEAFAAADGRAGLELARRIRPDIVICDIMLPELDGYGVLAGLQERPDTALIPFVFLTALTDRSDIRKGMVRGADDYLTKPFQVDELLISVRSQIQKRKELSSYFDHQIQRLRHNITTALPHEIRTPLNTIIGFSEMLALQAEGLDPDRIKEWGDHINIAAKRLHRMFENYMYFVKAEVTAYQSDLSKTEYRNARYEFCAYTIEQQAMAVADRYERMNDLKINADQVDLVQVSTRHLQKMIHELVDNAFKFSEAGAEVQVSATVEDGHYKIEVSDQGKGMTKEQLDAIGTYIQFEREIHEQQGLGLGLSIVKRLTELFGGTFSIYSLPGQGTQVTVNLLIVS